MKAKDEALAQVEKEKIAEKKREIEIMDRRFRLLCKKHALIEQKLTKMECFDKFIRTVQ